MLTYCFESTYVPRTLAKCKKSDLAVVDTEGHEKAVREAVKRGVWVYGYLNIGALEKERPYYEKLKHLRLAKYEGWEGEYWIDPTAREWQEHILSLAKQIKATGAIGLYPDNTDIYYEILERQIRKQYSRNLPSAQAVYTALSNMILKINALGMIVMPNGGDTFVRKFISLQYNKKSNYHTQAPRMHSKMVESRKRDGLPQSLLSLLFFRLECAKFTYHIMKKKPNFKGGYYVVY
jgi:endo-alpha-1,4-polygalactosaminidase (GH114 family)